MNHSLSRVQPPVNTRMMSSSEHRGPILLAESSEDDVYQMGDALRKAGVSQYLHVARRGSEAITYLTERSNRAEKAEPDLPSLILLRARLPDMEGTEVLRWIRGNSQTQSLRVYLVGSSVLELEIAKAQRERANGYWLKPLHPGEYAEFAGRIKARLEPTPRP